MSIAFKSAKGSYDVQGQDVAASVKVKLEDNLKVQLKYFHKANAAAVELEGHQWQAEYHLQSKDLRFEFERESKFGEVKIKQIIPGHKFELFPSPLVQVKTHLANGTGFSDRLKLGYDFQKSVGSIEETLFFSNKAFKLKLAADSVTKKDGASIAMKLRPRLAFLKALGLRYDHTHGPSLTLKAEPVAAVKAAAKLHLKAHTGEAVLKLKHGEILAGTELSLHGKLQYAGENRVAPQLRLEVEHEV